jgi:hypothetical protein
VEEEDETAAPTLNEKGFWIPFTGHPCGPEGCTCADDTDGIASFRSLELDRLTTRVGGNAKKPPASFA